MEVKAQLRSSEQSVENTYAPRKNKGKKLPFHLSKNTRGGHVNHFKPKLNNSKVSLTKRNFSAFYNPKGDNVFARATI